MGEAVAEVRARQEQGWVRASVQVAGSCDPQGASRVMLTSKPLPIISKQNLAGQKQGDPWVTLPLGATMTRALHRRP
jgi:hypothetical protein